VQKFGLTKAMTRILPAARNEEPCFQATLFPEENHEAENLLRIDPFWVSRQYKTATTGNTITRIFEELESKVRGYFRACTAVFDPAKGSYLFDEHGKESSASLPAPAP
jgi:hypothetical protein